MVTIATGRNTLTGITRFFADPIDDPDEPPQPIENLPILLDPKSDLAADMAVLGLPITVILNPEGEEIARMRGDAEWYSDSARAIIGQMLGSASDS